MKHKLLLALIFAFASNLALADSSVARNDMSKVARITPEMMAEMMAPTPEGGNSTYLCDSLGFVWHVRGFPKNPLIGEANLLCGIDPVDGAYEYWPWFVMEATAYLQGDCYCNSVHTMDLTWNANIGLFQGTAYSTEGCEDSVPVVVGRCRIRPPGD